jgi:hypothetical protein
MLLDILKKPVCLLLFIKKIIDGIKFWLADVYDTAIGDPNDKQQLVFQDLTNHKNPNLPQLSRTWLLSST